MRRLARRHDTDGFIVVCMLCKVYLLVHGWLPWLGKQGKDGVGTVVQHFAVPGGRSGHGWMLSSIAFSITVGHP